MQRLQRETGFEYDFSAREPRLVVAPGEQFVVETEDAMSGLIEREDQPPDAAALGEVLSLDRFNPCAGPIAVRGAAAGDVLAITIHEIVPAPSGVACVFEGLGPLADSAAHPDCRGPFTKVVTQDATGRGVYGDRLTFELAPHIGTIGLAVSDPVAAGADTNYGQGAFGGNIDCRDIAPGNTLLLPVAVEGGCLYLGDVHSAMADGELFGTGVETRADVTMSCEILSGPTIPAPRVQTPTHIVQLNSARPLEEAIDQAFRWMLEWLVTDYELSARDAYVLLGIHPEVRVCVYQVVRIGRLMATVGVAFPRSLLEQL